MTDIILSPNLLYIFTAILASRLFYLLYINWTNNAFHLLQMLWLKVEEVNRTSAVLRFRFRCKLMRPSSKGEYHWRPGNISCSSQTAHNTHWEKRDPYPTLPRRMGYYLQHLISLAWYVIEGAIVGTLLFLLKRSSNDRTSNVDRSTSLPRCAAAAKWKNVSVKRGSGKIEQKSDIFCNLSQLFRVSMLLFHGLKLCRALVLLKHFLKSSTTGNTANS